MIWTALLGLVGVIAASGAVTELFKRRDRRASILADLEIWEKLPDCATKDKLLDRLTTRIWVMSGETPSYSWLGPAFGISWVAFTSALWLISRGVSFQRDKQGALWASGAGYHLPFTSAAYIALGYVVGNLVLVGIGRWGGLKISNWLISRAEAKAAQQKPAAAPTPPQAG